MIRKNINKILSASFVFSLFGVSSYAGEVKSDNTPPVISYITEQIGDRERLRVTLTASDESGIREFIDHKGNTIIGNTTTVEFDRRGDSTFIAIDNAGNRSEVTIDLSWVNPYTKGIKGTKVNGSAYWTSSNLREWLNSDNETVLYTNLSADSDSGFLHEFTEDEKNAIAITERRIMLNPSATPEVVEGGSGNVGHASANGKVFLANSYDKAFNYKEYAYKKDLDKVFILTPQEAYWYLNRRGIEYNFPITPEAKIKNNLVSDFKSWWMQACSDQSNYEVVYTGHYLENLPHHTKGIDGELGVLPAINVEKDYVFKDGRVASSLNIGDEVCFGTYLGAQLKWKVVNISKEGYPMLLSSNVVDLRPFNIPGENARMYSDYVNFSKFDISTFDDVNYVSADGSNDIEPPLTAILNEEELNKRQNNSFTIELKFTDDLSGINYIQKPNGEKVYGESEISYTFNENGLYIFKSCDNSGNYNDYLVSVNNINQEPFIEINQSSTEWSNNVKIEMFTSSNVVFTKDSVNISNMESYMGSEFPNYNSYSGKKFKVSGDVEIVDGYNPDALNSDYKLLVRFTYKCKDSNKYTQTISDKWTTITEIPFDDVIENENVSFEAEYIIPEDFSYALKPYIETNKSSILGDLGEFNVSNLRYELVDDGDFKIDYIELPNGKIIKDTYSFTDTIIEEGINTYTYRIVDSRGKITEKTVTVKLDKTKPILNLNYNYDKFDFLSNKSLVVDISGSDALSGFKRIKLPDGTYSSSPNTTYTITDYGTYVFECEDVAGNITRETIVVEDMSAFEDAERLVEVAEQTRNSQDISIARESVNNLYESSKKDELQDRLNDITNVSDITFERKTATVNVDVYIKCENMLSLSLSSNSITFEDFNGTEDLEQNRALELTINSSLPYEINAYLEEEIQNTDKTSVMDKRILNLKESSTSDYKEFTDVKTKLTLVPNSDAGNNKIHNFDFKLNGGFAHKADVYKTTIKFEAVQK